MKLELKHLLPPTELVVEARSGTALGDCMLEAILLAVTEWRSVIFTHNGKRYLVPLNDLLETVKELKEKS